MDWVRCVHVGYVGCEMWLLTKKGVGRDKNGPSKTWGADGQMDGTPSRKDKKRQDINSRYPSQFWSRGAILTLKGATLCFLPSFLFFCTLPLRLVFAFSICTRCEGRIFTHPHTHTRKHSCERDREKEEQGWTWTSFQIGCVQTHTPMGYIEIEK